jgi:hypothetical protein
MALNRKSAFQKHPPVPGDEVFHDVGIPTMEPVTMMVWAIRSRSDGMMFSNRKIFGAESAKSFIASRKVRRPQVGRKNGAGTPE